VLQLFWFCFCGCQNTKNIQNNLKGKKSKDSGGGGGRGSPKKKNKRGGGSGGGSGGQDDEDEEPDWEGHFMIFESSNFMITN